MELQWRNDMADIAMCRNHQCLLKFLCYRYLAEPSEYQSMLMIDKPVATEEDCNHFWKCETDKELKQLNRMWRD